MIASSVHHLQDSPQHQLQALMPTNPARLGQPILLDPKKLLRFQFQFMACTLLRPLLSRQRPRAAPELPFGRRWPAVWQRSPPRQLRLRALPLALLLILLVVSPAQEEMPAPTMLSPLVSVREHSLLRTFPQLAGSPHLASTAWTSMQYWATALLTWSPATRSRSTSSRVLSQTSALTSQSQLPPRLACSTSSWC